MKNLKQLFALFIVVPFLCAMILGAAGCAQNTETLSDQNTKQTTGQATDQVTMQDTATARDGLRNAVVILTHPRGYGKFNADGAVDESDPDGTAAANTPLAIGDGPPGNYSIGDITITITNTDGSTGVDAQQAGTADGSAAGTQTGTQTPTVTTTQDIEASIALSLALAFSPGGPIDQALVATAARGDGSSVMDKETQQRLASMLQGGKITPDALNTILPAMLELIKRQNETATTKPATTKPAGT